MLCFIFLHIYRTVLVRLQIKSFGKYFNNGVMYTAVLYHQSSIISILYCSHHFSML